MSAGIYTPARWPICTGPFAYGRAAVTVNRLYELLLLISVGVNFRKDNHSAYSTLIMSCKYLGKEKESQVNCVMLAKKIKVFIRRSLYFSLSFMVGERHIFLYHKR